MSTEHVVTAWGRSSHSRSHYAVPEAIEFVSDAFRSTGKRGMIARGYGRSYGDQCLNDGGTIVDTTKLARIVSFDTGTGVLHCESGVSFAQLMPVVLGEGWIPPVCPGTSFVSMGGAIANDVHGKNQYHEGTFADHVEWFDLLLPSGDVTRVTAQDQADLFRATVAGIGLTGIILSVQFRLRRAASNAFVMTETRVPDLDTFLEVLPAASKNNQQAVGWIDAIARGKSMGRGILEVANQAEAATGKTKRREFSLPFDCPPWLLNRASVGAFNSLYYHRVPAPGRTRQLHASQFLYALDAIHHWNRLYGKPGVYQFQCALPFATCRVGLRTILEETVRSGSASFLAVLKCMGRRGCGLLSFTRPGFSLALDFPRRPETFALVKRLHDIVMQHDGAIYLAKDACLTAQEFQAMYPTAHEFKAITARVDPSGLMQSDMARRIGLR